MRLPPLLLYLLLCLWLPGCEQKTPPVESVPTILPAISTAKPPPAETPSPVASTSISPVLPLAVTSLVPAPNATVEPDTLILLNFEEPLDAVELEANGFELSDSSGVKIPLRLSIRGNSLTLSPKSALAHDTAYQVKLLRSLSSRSGKVLQELSWGFLTTPSPVIRPPSVVLVTPSPDETRVDPNQAISVYLSQPLDEQTVTRQSVKIQALHHTQNQPVAGIWQVEGTNLRFVPEQPWLRGLSYRVTLLPELKDLQGNRLEARFEWEFSVRSLAPGMVPIWPGTFQRSRPGKPAEQEVRLSKVYYILDHEVTVGEYRQCLEAGECQYPEPANPRFSTMAEPDRIDLPVNYISWEQAQEYTRWLTRQHAGSYRLCTEAEWEYAASANGQGLFGCGEDALCLEERAWHSQNLRKPGPQPVQRKAPNSWNLFDMQGNLWEWVQDWYGPLPSAAVLDPKGPVEGSLRTVRGGGFRNPPEVLELGQRGGSPPEARHDYLGFRVCADP